MQTSKLTLDLVMKHSIVCEQRKGYYLINFTCECGYFGRRRYYKNSFKPLCRKCLREHNKKEKAERHRKSKEALKRMVKLMDSVQHRNTSNDILWDAIVGKAPIPLLK